MRRSFVILLTLIMIFSCIASPVAAAEYYTWVSVLDYSVRSDVTNANSRFINLTTSSYKAVWDFPSPVMLASMDMVVFVRFGSLSNIVFKESRFHLTEIGSSSSGTYYRAHLDMLTPDGVESIPMWFDGSVGTQIYICSFNMRSVAMDRVDMNGTGMFYNGASSYSFTYPGSYSRNVSVGELDDKEVRLMFTLDASSYDYQEFIFNFRHINITSVNAYVDDVIIPIEVSPLNGNDSDQSYTYLNVRLDFTQFDRNTSFQCTLNITGYVPTAGEEEAVNVQYGVTQSTGYILDSESDPGGYWMKMIWWDMRGWFGNLQNIVIQYINDFRTDMINHFNNLGTSLSSHFNSLKGKLSSEFTALKQVINPNTSAGSDAEESIDNRLDELETITDSMNSLDFGSGLDVDPSINSYVNVVAIQDAGSIFNSIFQFPFFNALYSIALTLMLASFVLFGKK